MWPRNKQGLTLIEIMVAIGILAVIAMVGLLVSMSFFRTYSSHSEEGTIVSELQSARTEALDNIDEVRHGIRVVGSPLRYILFECAIATPQCTDYTGADTTKDAVSNASYNISIVSPSLPFDIVFDQLSGDCVSTNCATTANINLTDGTKTYTITINKEGQISW